MREYSSSHLLDRRDSRISQFPLWAMIVVPLAAIVVQFYLRLFFEFLGYLDLPLLVTIYFAMMRRSPSGGLVLGAVMGLAQDSLQHYRLGMLGICKTLVGYFAASIGLKIDVEQPMVRILVTLIFFVFHQFVFWVLQRALLAEQGIFDVKQNLIQAALNAVVGVALFHFLDKLRERD